jgi:hypothetical protein
MTTAGSWVSGAGLTLAREPTSGAASAGVPIPWESIRYNLAREDFDSFPGFPFRLGSPSGMGAVGAGSGAAAAAGGGSGAGNGVMVGAGAGFGVGGGIVLGVATGADEGRVSARRAPTSK